MDDGMDKKGITCRETWGQLKHRTTPAHRPAHRPAYRPALYQGDKKVMWRVKARWLDSSFLMSAIDDGSQTGQEFSSLLRTMVL